MLYDIRWDAKAKPLKQWQIDLLNAANHIEHHGWRQGGMGGDTGPVCAWGAVLAVTMPSNAATYGGIFRFIRGCLRLRFYLGEEVPRWNDRPERTKADVVNLLRNCAYKV